MTQLELCRAKNGTAAFFKWQKFVSLYLARMSAAWELWEQGSCGGMIWYELELFPNRLHLVWSCPLHVWWILSYSVKLGRLCIILHQLFFITSCLFFVIHSKSSANSNTGFIFSMTLRLKVPQPCYLWLFGEGLVIVSHAALLTWGPLRVWSVSVILHRHPAAGLWPEGKTEDSKRKWLCFLF